MKRCRELKFERKTSNQLAEFPRVDRPEFENVRTTGRKTDQYAKVKWKAYRRTLKHIATNSDKKAAFYLR